MIADQLNQSGYAICAAAYTRSELDAIHACISAVHGEKELFGMRRFLQVTPGLQELILNTALRKILKEIAPQHFIIKSIYFDKPPKANWFVSWHQDLNIFVKEKIESVGFKNWTKKDSESGVQPPAEFLGNIITLRIHLDDADETNGALKVIPHSHSIGVMRSQTVSFTDQDAVLCKVKAGDIMLMKPLTFHSSSRAISDKPRRVIHLELCSMELPEGMEWSQKTVL